MSPTDRAIRLACHAVVILWIAGFLGSRALAPQEIRIPVKTTSVETFELPPPEPIVEAEPEPIAEAEPEPIAEAEAEPIAELEPIAEEKPEAMTETEPASDPPVEARVADLDEPEEVDAELLEVAQLTPEPVAEAMPREVEALPEPKAETPPTVEPAAREPEPVAALPIAPIESLAAAHVPQAQPAPSEARAEVEPAGPEPALATPVADRVKTPVREVAEADVTRGGELLGDNGFPALESRYEGFGSFRDYARAMLSLGAQFVVVNRRQIVGTIDPWTLKTGSLQNPAELSPRARDYADEPALLRAGRAVRSQHGHRAEVMMLVPRRVDAALFGGIARALEAQGHEPGRYRQIRAHYERGPGGTLRLRVETAVRRDGREDPLPLLFDLQRLAGRSQA